MSDHDSSKDREHHDDCEVHAKRILRDHKKALRGKTISELAQIANDPRSHHAEYAARLLQSQKNTTYQISTILIPEKTKKKKRA